MKKTIGLLFALITANALAADCGTIVKTQIDAGVTCNLENQTISNAQSSASKPATSDDQKLLSLLLGKLRKCAAKAVDICEQ